MVVAVVVLTLTLVILLGLPAMVEAVLVDIEREEINQLMVIQLHLLLLMLLQML